MIGGSATDVTVNPAWNQFADCAGDMSHHQTPQSPEMSSVVSLNNNGQAIGYEVDYETAAPAIEVNTISNAHCLVSDVTAVSLTPGVNPELDPSMQIEMNGTPVGPNAMTPMLSIDSFTDAWQSVKALVNDQGPELAQGHQFVPETPQQDLNLSTPQFA